MQSSAVLNSPEGVVKCVDVTFQDFIHRNNHAKIIEETDDKKILPALRALLLPTMNCGIPLDVGDVRIRLSSYDGVQVKVVAV